MEINQPVSHISKSQVIPFVFIYNKENNEILMTNSSLQCHSSSYLAIVFEKPLSNGNYELEGNRITVLSEVNNEKIKESKMEIG